MTEFNKFKTAQEWMDDIHSRLNWVERNIEIPFYRHIWNHVTEFYYGLRHLPSNIRKWAKFVWTDRDWDYSHTLEAFEIKCRAQSRLLKEYGHCENSEIHAEDSLKCADALKRLRLDEYMDEYRSLLYDQWPKKGEAYLNECNEKRDVDVKIVQDSIEKMHYWWD